MFSRPHPLGLLFQKNLDIKSLTADELHERFARASAQIDSGETVPAEQTMQRLRQKYHLQ